DIEDLPGTAAASRYFSPVQTRRQRQSNAAIKTDLPAKKARQALKIEDLKTETKIEKVQIGAATITKCEVVPEVKQEPAEVKTEVDAPNADWWQQLQNIRMMRAETPAPVDTQGCHQCADADADAKVSMRSESRSASLSHCLQTQRFHKLVALMLSSQTKDEITFEAMKRLKAKTLTPSSVQQTPVDVLEGLLYPVSFYKNKAKYLKQTAAILVEKYDQDIPDSIEELLKLPGVGPKMGHICMATAWNRITGIGVDTHVHRISNRLAWLRKPTKEPEQTRIQLEAWLPRDLWAEVNHLLVGFGQTICTPARPKCGECLNRHICPAA
ncbi:hypothetical protein KR222_010264, partial [Zaprionus bogoriensis]